MLYLFIIFGTLNTNSKILRCDMVKIFTGAFIFSIHIYKMSISTNYAIKSEFDEIFMKLTL